MVLTGVVPFADTLTPFLIPLASIVGLQVLKSMPESDLATKLGVDKFGIRRKLYTRISEVFKSAPVKASEPRASPSRVSEPPSASTNPGAAKSTPLREANVVQQNSRVKIEVTNVNETSKAAEPSANLDEDYPAHGGGGASADDFEQTDAAKVGEQLLDALK